MCYRFHLKAGDLRTVAEKINAAVKKEFKTRYNIAPGAPIPGIRTSSNATGTEVVDLHWGLIPSWSKGPGELGVKMANARAETLTEKASFRNSFKARRCLIPASGFFEWQTGPRGEKLPWLLTHADGQPLLLAGLWEAWLSPDGTTLESCTIITTEPNELIRPFHDRMPVVLADDAVDAWLNNFSEDQSSILTLLKPYAAKLMHSQRVDTWVNSVHHDDERCIQPAIAEPFPEEDPQLGLGF